MNGLERFAVAWLLMWGLSYIFAALLAPEISGDVTHGRIAFSFIGVAILAALLLLRTSGRIIGRLLLLILGVPEVICGVASWTGIIIWNVPFMDKALFQVSMAFLDLVSATFMFFLAIEKGE